MLKRRTNKLQAKRALLPGDWEAVRTTMLPADYYKPCQKKEKEANDDLDGVEPAKDAISAGQEGASAKLMVMLQSWARRKYDVQSYTFTLPKQMLPTDKLLKKKRRLKPLKTKRAGLGKELQGQYNPIRAGSLGN